METGSLRKIAAGASLIAGAVFIVGPASNAASPLPSFATRVMPVVHFVLDTSGSMYTCDGGTVDESHDLRRIVGSTGYLFNPRLDTSDDGDCDGGHRRADHPYAINRIEALKLSLSKILDADGNGVVDSADEQVLRVKIGMTQFGDTQPYRTNTDTLKPIGSSFSDIWNAVVGMHAGGNTPSGAALAGGRALSVQNCYDGNPATPCNLGPNQTDNLGDDVAIACREYFVIFLTDGEPNTDSSTIAFDPIPQAKNLYQKTKAADAEVTPRVLVRTIGIGMAHDVDGNGSAPRGVINCMSFWGSGGGSKVADANKDGDNNPMTMDVDTNKSTAGTTAVCAGMSSLTPAEKGYGNGYFAADSNSLQNAFKKILNAIQAGTYSRSEPTLDNGTRGAATASAAYGAYFEVASDAIDWRGHFKKYLYDSTHVDPSGNPDPRYVDCDNATGTSTPVHPCWDGGDVLKARDWRTRRIFLVDPSSRLSFNPDLSAAQRTGWTGSDGSRPVTLHNAVPELAALDVDALALPATSTNLYKWSAMSTLSDATHVYAPTATDVSADAIKSSILALEFAAGRPDATFADGSRRCGADTCPPTVASPKLGDSFNTRPVVVGAPIGVVTDADYATEFLRRPLSALTGDDAAVITVSGSAVVASPCPSGVSPCTVGLRRTVDYLAANDGSIHAFDDVTGDELWAFIPPGHMSRLALQREGRQAYIDAMPTVRDVKFPCERKADGSCDVAANQLAFEDGKWHTILVLGQGMGGNFYFALDVTNPVAPVFLWEWRNPSNMGFTLAKASIAELPGALSTQANPGAAAFLPGGFRPTGGASYFQSVRAFDGTLLHEAPTTPADLAAGETSPANVANGQVGVPHAADGNLDGKIDRVYFGDREGRLWKACRITAAGGFDLGIFFDPAVYDRNDGSGVGHPMTPDSPTGGLDRVDGRKQLRGPIYFEPDTTRTLAGEMIVAFGSGDLQDPLSSPEGYSNFVWGLTDDPSLSNGGCGAAIRNAFFAGSADSITKAGSTFDHVMPMHQLLSASPVIFDKNVFFGEYDPDPDHNVCTDDYSSRLIARSVFDGAVPAGPFTDAGGHPTNVKTYTNTLVTGIDIDPRTGTLLVGTSSANPPDDVKITTSIPPSGVVGFKLH